MDSAIRWVVAAFGVLALLMVYGIWKDVDAHTGGGSFVSGALRGGLVFGGIYWLYKWAKGGKPKG